jgi:hypothetical protein
VGDVIKEEEMGVACDMYGGKGNASWVFGGVTSRKETTSSTGI